MILIETSLLALAYERRTGPEPPAVVVLRQMIRENVTLGIPGIVWQELLAGVRSESQFRQLEAHLADRNITGKDADAALGRANITVNKNAVPNDPRPPMVTSGLRIGTPASTTRGFKEREIEQVAIGDRVGHRAARCRLPRVSTTSISAPHSTICARPRCSAISQSIESPAASSATKCC